MRQPASMRAGKTRAFALRALPRGCSRRAQERRALRHHRLELRLAREHQGARGGEDGGRFVERAQIVPRRGWRVARRVRRRRGPHRVGDRAREGHRAVATRRAPVQLRRQSRQDQPRELFRRDSGARRTVSRPRSGRRVAGRGRRVGVERGDGIGGVWSGRGRRRDVRPTRRNCRVAVAAPDASARMGEPIRSRHGSNLLHRSQHENHAVESPAAGDGPRARRSERIGRGIARRRRRRDGGVDAREPRGRGPVGEGSRRRVRRGTSRARRFRRVVGFVATLGSRRGRGSRGGARSRARGDVRDFSRQRRLTRGGVHRLPRHSHRHLPPPRREHVRAHEARAGLRVRRRRQSQQPQHLRAETVPQHDPGRAQAAAIRDVPGRQPRESLPILRASETRGRRRGDDRLFSERRRRRGAFAVVGDGREPQTLGNAAIVVPRRRRFLRDASRTKFRRSERIPAPRNERNPEPLRGVDATALGGCARRAAFARRAARAAGRARRGGDVLVRDAVVGVSPGNPRRDVGAVARTTGYARTSVVDDTARRAGTRLARARRRSRGTLTRRVDAPRRQSRVAARAAGHADALRVASAPQRRVAIRRRRVRRARVRRRSRRASWRRVGGFVGIHTSHLRFESETSNRIVAW